MFDLAAIAWNASLVTKSDPQDTIDDLLKKLPKGDDSLMEEDTGYMINEMSDRQHKIFTDNQQLIMYFELPG